MTLSAGAATDAIYTLAQAAVVDVSVNDEAAVAVDGAPTVLVPAMFVVGLSSPPGPDTPAAGDTTGTRAWIGVGAQRIQEDYTIPCYITVVVPGQTQKTARDLAELMFNTWWGLFNADKTLGGVLQGGMFAEVVDLTSTPSNTGTAGNPGRRQLITFGVHCRNRTT